MCLSCKLLHGQTLCTPEVKANTALLQEASLGLPQLIGLKDDASCPSCKQVLCVALPPALFWIGKGWHQEVEAALSGLLLCIHWHWQHEAAALL